MSQEFVGRDRAMMIDSFAGTIPTLAPAVRSEKKPDIGEPRPVEGSKESQDAHLDINRERLAGQKKAGEPHGQRCLGAATYNAKGDLTEKRPPENPTARKQAPIDLTI